MGVINSKDIGRIIRKSLMLVDEDIMLHGEIVGYIFYKMMQYTNRYFLKEMADFTMIGVLHDIGLFKSANKDLIREDEEKHVWRHTIYGYLFLRYLSPLGEGSEIVLYHHLDYNRYPLIKSKYMELAEYLSFADKLDTFMRSGKNIMDADFFAKKGNIVFSENAKILFLRAETKYHILSKIKDSSYQGELYALLSKRIMDEEEKRRMIQLLVYTIDFRSEYTVVHSIATTTFAVEIAKLMKLSDEDIYLIYYGALLHDIGKLTTPVEILEAPRRLTKEEMDIMKQHVENTEKILRGSVDERVLEIAIRHHEKLDGSGYYRGLTGKELTTPQRIVAVADIISALYGKRSYKEKFNSEQIKSVLRKEAADGKLCPKVTVYAISNMDYLIQHFEEAKKYTIGKYILIKEQYKLIYEKFKKFEIMD